MALGLAGPIGPAMMMSVMVVAAVTVHLGHGFFVSTNGVELLTLYSTGAVVLALAGTGRYSLHYVLGLDRLYSQMTTLIGLT